MEVDLERLVEDELERLIEDELDARDRGPHSSCRAAELGMEIDYRWQRNIDGTGTFHRALDLTRSK